MISLGYLTCGIDYDSTNYTKAAKLKDKTSRVALAQKYKTMSK